MRVTVVGTGYVGLTTGTALAFLGHQVTCVDVDSAKLAALEAGEVPIHEPGLPELLQLSRERLRFTTEYGEAVRGAEVILIAVGTPGLPSGEPDLSAVRSVARAIGQHLGDAFTVIVNKSTVPIGSGNWVDQLVREAIEERSEYDRLVDFIVASNPEFLREGSAVYDALYPDRIVVGVEDDRAVAVLAELYRPLLNQDFTAPAFLPRPAGVDAVPFVTTDLASAELIKYAANAFLALKISFINDIGTLAERVGADVLQVARGIGLDSRIGNRFLQAGVGWGGSCFGKDTAALLATGREYNLDLPTVRAAREVNHRQRERVIEKLQSELKILKGRVVSILGLAFKPHTDDLRDSPAIEIATRLVLRGAKVRAHDPVALDRARRELPGLGVTYCDTLPGALHQADAVVLVTDWPQYGNLPWAELAHVLRGRVIMDCRNLLDGERLATLGFRYVSMGRGERGAIAAPVLPNGHRATPVGSGNGLAPGQTSKGLATGAA
jgi:UDPglucose 6-dehydrogenase